MNGNDCQTTRIAISVYAAVALVVAQLNCDQSELPTSQCGILLSAQSTRPPSGLNIQ